MELIKADFTLSNSLCFTHIFTYFNSCYFHISDNGFDTFIAILNLKLLFFAFLSYRYL